MKMKRSNCKGCIHKDQCEIREAFEGFVEAIYDMSEQDEYKILITNTYMTVYCNVQRMMSTMI